MRPETVGSAGQDRIPDTAADWTVGHEGRSNSSLGFHAVVDEVERLIRSDAHMLLSGRADKTARLIVAHLAHKFGMTPDPASEAYSEAKARWAIEGTEDAD